MKCPSCNEPMSRMGYKHVTKVGGFTVTDGSGMLETCPACGEVSLSTDELAGYERRAAWHILTEGKKVGGEVLRYARKALGLRQKDLAHLLRHNEQQVSRWENSDDELAMDLRLAMAALLGIAETRELPTLDAVGAMSGRSLEIRRAS